MARVLLSMLTLALWAAATVLPDSAVAQDASAVQRTLARGRVEQAVRSGTATSLSRLQQPRRGPALEGEGGGAGDKVERMKHGAFSLLVPGWSQFRSGHTRRAIFFASAEAAIWSTWIFSKLQGNYREDQYIDWAQQFAQVQSRDHDDDYWRAVASYRDSDAFNTDVRRDLRAGQDPEAQLVSEADSWRWQSEQRFDEFKQLRADAISADDRADFVLVFLLVNRVVAFADAVRSGPPDRDQEQALQGVPALDIGRTGLRLGVTMDPDPELRTPSLVLGGLF